ncbi:MAG: bifunctional UDP-N-acetylmuramoyl-tripeptide:D-alanyl-D-alanine ligase/alanine racemase, partial [Bacteroidetes bacterium]|nr:bifunctional UDP-N-acetylmuramoyl-tripeptide:D-alanyl-D-alanine ligase/alanine racemase [Bacteroidota bacterium]
MRYRASHIAALTDSIFIGTDSEVAQISFDSRKNSDEQFALFVAIPGGHRDGHQFLNDAYAKGFRTFLASHIPTELKEVEATWIINPNPLHALQTLARAHRSRYDIPVLAITGSHGKTIVKEWLYHVLHRELSIARSPKSYNSQLGVPLSVLLLDDHHNLGVFEAGISEKNEMTALRDVIQPSLGLFTNLGKAHDAGFASMDAKLAEKFKLFDACHTLISRIDDDQVRKATENWSEQTGGRLISWSTTRRQTHVRVRILKRTDHSAVSLKCGDQFYELTLPFIDDASLENAIHVWCVVWALGLDVESVTHHFARLMPVEMRLNQKSGIHGTTLICDYYNADLTSLEIALDWMSRQENHHRKTVILSDIEQSNLSDQALAEQVASTLNRHQINRVLAVGSLFANRHKLLDTDEFHHFESTETLLKSLGRLQFEQETILLKGGRRFQFERIERRLQRQAHNTVLEVNMNALRHNLQFFRNRLKPDTALMVMVKAYSYGSGGHEIAHFLQHEGVDYLAVAYADEGVALRNDGIHLPIMVMNSDADSYELMLEYDLEPEVFSQESLAFLIEALERHPERSCKIHLELNSGMNRLGFDSEDIDQIMTLIHKHPQLSLVSVFSHLAMSDEAHGESFTKKQIQFFEQQFNRVTEGIKPKPIKHILNSAGILRFPQAQFNMVRLGIGIYGIDPSRDLQGNLEYVG